MPVWRLLGWWLLVAAIVGAGYLALLG